MKIKEVIIAEGKADRLKVEQAVNADSNETKCTAINKQTIEKSKHPERKRGVIVFTDRDYAGERIRKIIQENVPRCKHAFLTKKQARPKKRTESLGIAHATVQDIRQALKGVYEVFTEEKSSITKDRQS